MNKYEWKGMNPGISAETVANTIEMIERRDGYVTPDSLLEEATLEESPIHGLFEWSDSVAAHKYRRMQAGQILRAVIVRHETGTKQVAVRGFVNIPDRKNSRYVSVTSAMQNPDERDVVLERALAELRWFQKKYADLQELAGVFEAVDQVAL